MDTEIVTAVPHYTQKEDDQKKLERHREVKNKDENRLQKDCKKEINFHEEYEGQKA